MTEYNQVLVWVWLGAFVLAVIIEALTMELVSIWIACGALPNIVLSLVNAHWGLQLGVFFGVTIILLILTRPFVMKYLKRNTILTNVDSYIGEIATVTKEILKDEPGEVNFKFITWRAISDTDIPIGSKVKILAIEGIKLIVKLHEIENKEEF